MAESKDIFPLKIGNITTGLIIDTKYMPGLHERYAGFKDGSNVDFFLECQEDDKVRNPDKYAKLQALLRELKPAEGDILPAHVQRLLCPKANLTHDQLVIQDDLSFKIELDLSKKRGMLHFHPRHRIFGYRNNFFKNSFKFCTSVRDSRPWRKISSRSSLSSRERAVSHKSFTAMN